MDFVAYYRVSTNEQGRSGSGLNAQREGVSDYFAGKDIDRLDEITEIESGKKNNRPELEKALRRCLLTRSTLIIAKLEGLSRDVEFIAKLQKSKVNFVCVDMPEANTLTIDMMAVLAQHERKLISERTRHGLAAAKARGQMLGNPNLDRDRNTDTTAATNQNALNAQAYNAELAELIVEYEADAGRTLSANELVTLLNDAGYRSRRGRKLSRIQVYRAKRTI